MLTPEAWNRVNRRVWPVLDNCPAPRHNSLRAAYGRSTTKAERLANNGQDTHHPPCICPRSLDLKRAEYRRKSAERSERRNSDSVASWAYMKNIKTDVRTIEMPTGGACSSTEGMRAIDALFDKAGDRRSLIARVKTLCYACPVIASCETWVRTKELRPGSWPGIYAGLTPGERAKKWGTGDEKKQDKQKGPSSAA